MFMVYDLWFMIISSHPSPSFIIFILISYDQIIPGIDAKHEIINHKS